MKLKVEKQSLPCIFAIIIIVVSYAAERFIELFAEPTATLGMVLALVMAVLFCVVLGIIAKSEDTFTGLLAAIIGYKMMPVSISFLGEISQDGELLYYLLTKAAAVVFIILIIRLYNMQEKPPRITALPLIAMLFAIPFASEIGVKLTDYFLTKTGSMMGGYFSQYLCYSLATLVILVLAFISTYPTMRFTAYFEFTTLSINILRTVAKIAFRLYNHMHVSKSLYVWIAVCIFLIVLCFIAKIIKKKNVYNI